MKKIFILCFFLFNTSFCFSKIKVVTTLEVLKDIVNKIGKENVEVISLSYGTQDPHFVEPRPSMVVQLKNADLLVKIGMDLDMWVDSLIDASRNSKIFFGKPGYLDVSQGIEKLDIIEGKVDGSLGDVHPQGNPHYWLDPINAKIIAKTITERLSLIEPSLKKIFENNLREFDKIIDNKMVEWSKQLEFLKDKNIITFHRSWGYFAKRFSINIIGELEPKPGIPPSAKHLSELIKLAEKNKIEFILKETFYPNKPAEYISQKTSIKIINVPNNVGGIKDAKDYIGLMDYIVEKISELNK